MPTIEELKNSNVDLSIENNNSNLRKLLLEDTLDVAPIGLTFCFDRESFLNNDFKPDDFILEQHCRGISLEKLHYDLLQYSNILKSSLIELINQDYADFVSLSTNLVGLDKSIDTIVTPLKQLQSYVSSVVDELESTDQELSAKLKSLQHIKNEQDYADSLFTLDACVSRLERWLTQSNQPSVNKEQTSDQLLHKSNNIKLDDSDNNDNETSKDINSDGDENELDIWPIEFYADCSLHEDIGQRMDRIANEYIKLQFFNKKCRGHPILNSLKPRINWITVNLQEQLEIRLKESFKACCLTVIDTNVDCTIPKHSIEQLRQVLSIYLAIDKLSDLLILYRKFVLHDQLSQIFTPRPELTHAGSDIALAAETLNSMYTRALKVLDSQLYYVKEQIIRYSPEGSEPLSDFDCLVGGFWPETIDLICNNLSEIFSPGHPDRFYSLYTISMNFIKTVETKTWSTNQLVNLRNHPSYSMFIDKWSLPVYFQIRFQEIAGNVENAMKKGLIEIKESRKSCLIEVTEVVICQLNRCWEKGIYLDKLIHRFWKLTLQILSRYSSFIDEQIKSIQENNATASQSSDSISLTKSTDCFPELLIYFFVDCLRLVDYVRLELKGEIFTCLNQRLVLQTMNNDSNDDTVNYETILSECLEQSCERLITSTNSIMDLIIQKIQQNCLNSIRQVLDIPRQYRWTNREFPSNASLYVSNIIHPLMKLDSLGLHLSQSVPNAQPFLSTLIKKCITTVTHDYTAQLSEVSTSVRKMEDSLRRLREVRRGSSQISNQSQSVNGSSGFHSDDKIRHQLYLDAKAYIDEVRKFWSLDREYTCELDDFIEQIDTTRTEPNICNMNTIPAVSQE